MGFQYNHLLFPRYLKAIAGGPFWTFSSADLFIVICHHLLAIDFEKAFDSFNHSFILKRLEKVKLGPYFLQWIKTFYTNVSSCVLKDGFTDHWSIPSSNWCYSKVNGLSRTRLLLILAFGWSTCMSHLWRQCNWRDIS